jgi:hypothetical protein
LAALKMRVHIICYRNRPNMNVLRATTLTDSA